MNSGVPLIGFVLALLFLCLSWWAGRRQRLVSDLPTSKTTGVFIGLVELKGTAEVPEPLVSFLAGRNCVYYRWQVEESWSRTVTETYTDSDGKVQTRTRTESGWKTVASGSEEVPFYLQDDCGAILIRPAQARLEPITVFHETCGQSDTLYYAKGPTGAVADSDGRRRFVEYAIPLHAPLYVVGHAREREDVVAPEIAYDPKAEMFLISTRSEEQVSRGLRWQFWLFGLLGIACAVGGFWAADATAGPFNREAPALYVASGAGALLLWLLGWGIMVYNSLVNLRQRVRQAWANVEVQLKRRADLIPNLIKIVQGMRDHERHLQDELAHLRQQLVATPPGQPGPDPQAVVATFGAIVERYPELKANEAFVGLRRNLVDTEQRIALARGYFNEIATFFNTRLEIVPDRFFATLGALKPQALLLADQFERASAPVKFAA